MNKRIAAHKVLIDGICYTNHIAEFEDDIMVNHYPLSEELPNTIWQNKLEIQDNKIIQ